MVPQTSNMVDVVIRSVRIFKVQKNGDLHDKLTKDVSLLCEHCSQGITIKILSGIVWCLIAKNQLVLCVCSRLHKSGWCPPKPFFSSFFFRFFLPFMCSHSFSILNFLVLCSTIDHRDYINLCNFCANR